MKRHKVGGIEIIEKLQFNRQFGGFFNNLLIKG